MKKLTKEEYLYLKKFENQFITAKCDYMRNIATSDIEEIIKIYSRLIDRDYTMNKHCSACTLRLIKLMLPYYEAGAEETTQQTVQTTENNEGSEQGEESKSNKRRTKKSV